MLSSPAAGGLDALGTWFKVNNVADRLDDVMNGSFGSQSGDVEARKRALEADLEEEMKRLERERKANLSQLDFELAEAVESIHLETVRKANEKMREHRKALARLQGQGSSDSEGSSSASEEDESSDDDHAPPLTNRQPPPDRATALSSPADSEAEESEGSEEEPYAFWSRMRGVLSLGSRPWGDTPPVPQEQPLLDLRHLQREFPWRARGESRGGDWSAHRELPVAATAAASEQRPLASAESFLTIVGPPSQGY